MFLSFVPRNRSKIVPNSNRFKLNQHFQLEIKISLTSAPSAIDQERVEIWPFSNDKHHIPKWPLGKIRNFWALSPIYCWGRSIGTQDRVVYLFHEITPPPSVLLVNKNFPSYYLSDNQLLRYQVFQKVCLISI